MKIKGLYLWEWALGVGFLVALLAGALQAGAAAGVEDKVLRLHVLAASDSAEDQALKLDVRDRVLALLAEPLSAAETVQEAERIAGRELPRLERELTDFVRAQGSARRVSVTLTQGAYPTRYYDSFALPAGQYRSLRVTLDEGAGQNWWCVVFPALCTSTVLEELDEESLAALSREDIALITMESEEYVIRFKLLEWLGWLKNRLAAR